MNKLREKNILKITSELWFKNNLKPGFDIINLVRSLGLSYEERDFDSGISGLLVLKRSANPVMCIKKSDIPERKRFSSAHELGHYYLHSDAELNLDKEETIYLRDINSSTGTYTKEVEANFFAASLLMPEFEVRKNINPDLSFENNVEHLAELFKVSSSAIGIRLNYLGYI